jgi:hypothetical protein
VHNLEILKYKNSISQDVFETYPSLIQESILKGILKSDSMEQQQNAINTIHILLKSEDPKKQLTALTILSQEYLTEFESEIFRLMASKEVIVHIAAIDAAGKSKSPAFIPQLIALLLITPGSNHIIESLSNYGDAIFEHLKKIPFQSVIHKQGVLSDIIRIAEISAGPKGGEFLFSILHHSPPHLKERIVEVLSISKYILEPKEKERMERMLKEEIGFAVALLEGIEDASLNPRLHEAFNFDYENCKRRIITISGLLYNRK